MKNVNIKREVNIYLILTVNVGYFYSFIQALFSNIVDVFADVTKVRNKTQEMKSIITLTVTIFRNRIVFEIS